MEPTGSTLSPLEDEMTDQEFIRSLLSDARDALEIAPDIGHERAIHIALRRIKSALEKMKENPKT